MQIFFFFHLFDLLEKLCRLCREEEEEILEHIFNKCDISEKESGLSWSEILVGNGGSLRMFSIEWERKRRKK